VETTAGRSDPYGLLTIVRLCYIPRHRGSATPSNAIGSMLHITNGDNTVALMREVGLRGVYLPWRDLLHEGPVPADLDLPELSKLRARFIAVVRARPI
jgi:hypothetical protein